ncbi:hypothetical protein [Mechercharimyces sp. CAU 1602]|uniref:hypothetical protein n=1 Tax=Mechercharimyces sp. CAU 1602 TaxID=2973933 RepID=UPI002162BAB7|nr:hypothetical protein [Mechercharimyces sp. CAU 1602]
MKGSWNKLWNDPKQYFSDLWDNTVEGWNQFWDEPLENTAKLYLIGRNLVNHGQEKMRMGIKFHLVNAFGG